MCRCLLLLLLLLAGCGSAARHPHATQAGRPTSTSQRIDGCLSIGPSTRAIVLHPRGKTIKAVLVGTGTTTFVLSNESDQNLCSWLPFVRALKAHHDAALLYDYDDPTELPNDALAGAQAARAAGARRVIFTGASVGARASITAAAKAPPGVVAVVTFSAERTVSSDPTDLVRRARRVTIPTLLISTRDDPFVNGATTSLLRALGSTRKQALILPGTDHGTSLLTDSNRRRVQAAIFAFVDRPR